MEWHDTMDMRHRRRDLLLGLWMRSAIVGAFFVAAGIVSLLASPPRGSFATALTWIVLGGALALIGWRRTTALLDRIDTDVPFQPQRYDASSQRPAVRAPELTSFANIRPGIW